MTDMSLPVKAAVLNWLSNTAPLLLLVPASQIYSSTSPPNAPLPFVRYGKPIVSPFEDTCGLGSEVEVTLHVFAKTEDEAYRISSELVLAMATFTGSFRVVECSWERTQITTDDQDRWHGIVQFRILATP